MSTTAILYAFFAVHFLIFGNPSFCLQLCECAALRMCGYVSSLLRDKEREREITIADVSYLKSRTSGSFLLFLSYPQLLKKSVFLATDG